MSRRAIAVVNLLIVLAALSGCGGDDDGEAVTAPPTTPSELVAQLAGATQTGDVDALLALMTPDAAEQTGAVWLKYLDRTASDDLIQLFSAVKAPELNRMKSQGTKLFLKDFHRLAPEAFAMMFNFYLSSRDSFIEEEGQVLVLMTNDRDRAVYLAMARQADGSLKLVGENQSDAVLRKLKTKLHEKILNAQREAEAPPS